MGIRDVAAVLTQVPTLLKLKRSLKPRPLDENDSYAAQVERNAERFGDRTAIVFEGKQISWRGFNALANQYAHAFKEQGLVRGDTVSVMMDNRIEFLAVVVALNKLGVTGALINTNLTHRPLAHCIEITDSKKCIFGEEVASAIAEVKADLSLAEGNDFLFVPDSGEKAPGNWAHDLEAMRQTAPSDNPPETNQTTLGENALYIFTSGTTGLPKAAVLSNRRYLATGAMSAAAGLKCTEQDRLYVCLPLYHGTGLIVGVGAAFNSGASLFIRRRFSASNFLNEVREHRCTGLVYIGELCRYLTNSPAKPDDHENPLVSMIGNGMRPDVWMNFKNRYGVKRITEFYGASEGNVSFANLMNKDCTIGMTANKVALVKYDIDADEIVLDNNGRCIEVEPGEPGLLLGHISETATFEGYTDKEATERKVVRNALEEGDAWFNSGDLIKQIDVGFSLGYPHYQFVDRVGDTFRWKSENVSTNEVGEIINNHSQVKFCNVYGVEVPQTDGRAGMVAITLNDGETFNPESFAQYVCEELPAYSRPVFVRIQPDIDVTGTFKMLKGNLRKEAYNLAEVDDPIYVMKPHSNTYTRLDHTYSASIKSGEAGF